MTEPAKTSLLPKGLLVAVVALLTLQVGLLWMQGSLLQRQHGDLQGLREDVQDLSDSLDQFEDTFDQGAADGAVRPSSRRVRHHPGVLRVRLQEEGGRGDRKALEDQRKSEKDAVAQARDVQEKLSWEENARKAEEKKRLEELNHKTNPLIYVGVGVAILALILRSWFRRRG